MRWILFFLFTVGCLHADKTTKKPIEFVIVTPSYNNESFCETNLQSILSQTYPHWSLIYINDCSSDRTGMLADEFIQNHHLTGKCRLIHNKKRKGAMANFYRAIHKIDGRKVVVHLDGDDKFAHSKVLEKLAKVYSNKKVWMTYGSYQNEPNDRPGVCAPFPEDVMRQRKFRSHPWVSSALRTYYAELFHKINKEDFFHEGNFFSVASDLAIMFPLLEMASLGHIHFIDEILYIYNHTTLCDYRVQTEKQLEMDAVIRQKQRYEPLKTLFFARNKN